MKLPRDLSGEQLIKVLERHGYEPIRRSGSHIRLTHPGPPRHFLTIPLPHDPERVAEVRAWFQSDL